MTAREAGLQDTGGVLCTSLVDGASEVEVGRTQTCPHLALRSVNSRRRQFVCEGAPSSIERSDRAPALVIVVLCVR